MKKVRFPLVAIAIALGIGSAVASSSKAPCDSQAQYYRSSNGVFYPAGEIGVDYVCQWDHFTVCTYYYDAASGQYKPCKYGKLLWLR
ncbi:hypothetical protein [Chitinophaga barathri]|uniref:DUF3551 domain-containing protein n=1 Tax=Chitinophaga barathri TaxID=1647451 RepID=A0A3N4M4D4_9BACT|nr:hypothetical protein [Chitinophaga barathri]RPD37931.1 hypothetical protein EG028_27675 [Chitinophaga barathri]